MDDPVPEAVPEPAAPPSEREETGSSAEEHEPEQVELDDYEVWRYGGGLA
ncbi:MAG TPA: hypothetical protein VGO31_00270 [Microbacteriaceae bacterium]|jgi:hypothetical protein|nr:hypothetical protein [Microbacteriaceae bacterium]